MTQDHAHPADPLSDDLFAELASLTPDAGVALLHRRKVDPVQAVVALAQAALARVEHAPDDAEAWLAIARALDAGGEGDPAGEAWIAYAQARLHLTHGDLAAAEASLRLSQDRWLGLDDAAALARSQLGLTQLLAMQGRYDEAQAAIDSAIDLLTRTASGNPALLFLLAVAHRNRATLFGVQDRHTEALKSSDAAVVAVIQADSHVGDVMRADLDAELAHISLNRSIILMHLGYIRLAESALLGAIQTFGRMNDRLNRGRALTNLGSLYVRTGRYADALARFEAARHDLLPDEELAKIDIVNLQDDETLERLQRLDALLLDQAGAYLALNLRPEAAAALAQAEALYRRTDQPYELGQTLYTRGVLNLGEGDLGEAAAALNQALARFEALGNRYWINRTRLAQARLVYARGEGGSAAQILDQLLVPVLDAESALDAENDWDAGTLAEALLLRLRLHLDAGEIDAARALDNRIEAQLAAFGDGAAMLHLRWRLAFAKGLIARAAGDSSTARSRFWEAVGLIEVQRISLPLEEARSAYLEDKAHVYSALVAVLLEDQTAGEDAIAAAFNVVERARSRALLERLLAAMSGEDDEPAIDPKLEERRVMARRRLHWLYNQLLGDSGGRRPVAAADQTIADAEAVLQRLEWRRSPLLAQADPVRMEQLQQILEEDELAVVYYSAPSEIMAFVISARGATVTRHLCTPDELTAALRNWRFQLGRAEIGGDYLARHRERLIQGAQNALARLYDLLVAPLEEQLTAPRLRFIPHGALHHVPFHALFDGERHLLQRWECISAPSASIATTCHRSRAGRMHYDSLAALALSEPGLPNVRTEVRAAARHFSRHWLYLDDDATDAALHRAASQADVLHLATHGLMRADNPYFSSLKLADGWQDVRALYRLPLSASLVVLSACESGAGQVQGGDEVVGLARGFIGAGAPMVVASLWNVDDASSAQLMAYFYAALTKNGGAVSPPAALRSAQEIAITEEQHPYYWASFYAIG